MVIVQITREEFDIFAENFNHKRKIHYNLVININLFLIVGIRPAGENHLIFATRPVHILRATSEPFLELGEFGWTLCLFDFLPFVEKVWHDIIRHELTCINVLDDAIERDMVC